MSDFTEVCLVGDLPIDRARRFVVDGRPIAVVRTEEGVFAIDDRCSHADVALSDGEVEGCAIECWLHGSAFDLRTGVPLSLPATVPVAVYEVRLEGEGDAAAVLVGSASLPVH
ncbi:MAG: Rieske 2Fe-2S domain-containing protein [Actinomycetales bacterium]|nr:Rieske 2Fe-2S domain-containing protein [Actinomycetales bacterium]